MKTWRSSSNRTLWARPIYEHEWPKLIQAMKDDGLLAVIQSDDYTIGYSDSVRQSVMGNGWTVDMIVHILQSAP